MTGVSVTQERLGTFPKRAFADNNIRRSTVFPVHTHKHTYTYTQLYIPLMDHWNSQHFNPLCFSTPPTPSCSAHITNLPGQPLSSCTAHTHTLRPDQPNFPELAEYCMYVYIHLYTIRGALQNQVYWSCVLVYLIIYNIIPLVHILCW